jgi:hypothetical protein
VITAVDSNILIDILCADPRWGRNSERSLRQCLAGGSVVACDVVYGEVAGLFPSADRAREVLHSLGVRFEPTPEAAALDASRIYRQYRGRGGSRVRLMPDFLVGSHARVVADRLLTRDRGFYRAYYRALTVIGPDGPEAVPESLRIPGTVPASRSERSR